MADEDNTNPHEKTNELSEKLERLIDEFAHEEAIETGEVTDFLLDTVIIVWEQLRYDERGNVERMVRYTMPNRNHSMSAALGLMDVARTLLKHNILCDHDED